MYIDNGKAVYNTSVMQSLGKSESRVPPKAEGVTADMIDKYLQDKVSYYCKSPAIVLDGCDIVISYGGCDRYTVFRSPDLELMEGMYDSISNGLWMGDNMFPVKDYLNTFYTTEDRIIRLACIHKYYGVPMFDLYSKELRGKVYGATKYI
jgi:hypothetical protein